MTGSVVPQKFENIATWMTSTQPTNLPRVLKGVFFMDGNPLPDDCITMYNQEWDETMNCLHLTGHRTDSMDIPPQHFGMDPSMGGAAVGLSV
ncbi:MAG: hypothetical protein AAF572_26535 [Cyanobacteria bacterium P01_B01_bin.77]